MATIRRFEDIKAWQKARELDQAVTKLISSNDRMSRDATLCDQIDRAAGSVPANIVEGFGRNGNREFRQFLSQAKGSAAEVKSHLYRALDKGYISQEEMDSLYDLADHTERLLGAFVHYLSQSKQAGSKLKNDQPKKTFNS